MYSYEDRIRAVELYIKLGKRVRPTIRQLGYPTKNSLKGWCNEYQQKFDLPAGYAGRKLKFSQEQRAAASQARRAVLPPSEESTLDLVLPRCRI
ncbi:transposase-like protein [Variovorax boronicumulans]|nr:transposase-like protein [Variovorax boronicumulans]